MKKPSSSHYFFFVFFISITIKICSAQNLIESSCKTFARNNPNINYGFCVTSLQAAPASRCATSKGLGMIAIRLIRYNVTDTRCLIKQMLKNKKWGKDPYVKQCLNDCFDLYSDAISTVKEAMKYYNAKKYDDANVKISAVMEASTTCEEGFKERDGVVSPLTKRNDDVFELSAVALSIMRMIDQKGSGRF